MSYRAVDNLIIQSSDSAAKLVFSDPEYNTDPRLDYFVATIENTGLRASSRVYAYMSEALVKLFDNMAVNWKGWVGEKRAETIEGDLIFSCTSDHLGHAFVNISLSSLKHNWTVRAVIRLDAGQLEEIARGLRRFLGTR